VRELLKKLHLITRLLNTYRYIFLIILILPSVWWLTGSGFYNMHDDLQVMRIYEIERCFWDGQIPCRWSPDMSFGFGQPMFNYYSALPYYLGLFFKLVFSTSIIGSVKFLFLFSLLAGGIGMYLLAKEFWGFWGGIIASVLYTYAPYHAVDVYVRGALAENFSLAILPFLWLFIYRVIIKNEFRDRFILTISISALLTTHNISLLMFTPFTLLWIFFWYFKTKSPFQKLIVLGKSGLLGFGLASFFIIPVLFEQNLIQTQHLISEYYTYSSHFASLKQLFISRFWGDGGSIFGPNDGMSFAVGWPHWWLLILLIPLALKWVRNYEKPYGLLLLTLILMFLISVFLTHQRSYLIWQSIDVMKYIQFPWRFLGLTIFFISFSGGAIGKLPAILRYILIIIVIFSTFYFNISYFTPVNYSRLVTDEGKFSGDSYISLQKGGVADYLPKEVKIIPDTPVRKEPLFIRGSGKVDYYNGRSNGFEADIFSQTSSQVIFPYIYFPNWEIFVNGVKKDVTTDGVYDVIKIDLEKGVNTIEARFYNTPVRTISNLISVISLLILGFTVIKRRKSMTLNVK